MRRRRPGYNDEAVRRARLVASGTAITVGSVLAGFVGAQALNVGARGGQSPVTLISTTPQDPGLGLRLPTAPPLYRDDGSDDGIYPGGEREGDDDSVVPTPGSAIPLRRSQAGSTTAPGGAPPAQPTTPAPAPHASTRGS